MIFLYIRYRNSKQPTKENLKKSKKTKENQSNKAARKNSQEDEEDEDTESDDDDKKVSVNEVKHDAEKLYNTVHDRMVNGMKKEEFLDVAGDMVDKFVYIELKQLYNDSRSKGLDPSKAVTAKDYAKVLQDTLNDS